MEDSRFSLEKVFDLRTKAFAEISEHAFACDRIAAAIADVDAAMQTAIAERCIDDTQALVTAARSLADLLKDGGRG